MRRSVALEEMSSLSTQYDLKRAWARSGRSSVATKRQHGFSNSTKKPLEIPQTSRVRSSLLPSAREREGDVHLSGKAQRSRPASSDFTGCLGWNTRAIW